jgi:hypothetical protein
LSLEDRPGAEIEPWGFYGGDTLGRRELDAKPLRHYLLSRLTLPPYLILKMLEQFFSMIKVPAAELAS